MVQKVTERIDELGDIDQKYYCSNYCDVSVNKYDVKCRKSLKFWESLRFSSWLVSVVF